MRIGVVAWSRLTLTLSIFMDRSVQGKKVQTGYTALIEAPAHELQNTESRPDHNTENFMPFMFRQIVSTEA